MESVPSQNVLDNFRHYWISGLPLSVIIKAEPEADKLSKNYYGFLLPWIIHAISQMFDSESEQIFTQTYASIAMFVELGLPNIVSSNIYLAGVRSRSAALELSSFDLFQHKSISELDRLFQSSKFKIVKYQKVQEHGLICFLIQQMHKYQRKYLFRHSL